MNERQRSVKHIFEITYGLEPPVINDYGGICSNAIVINRQLMFDLSKIIGTFHPLTILEGDAVDSEEPFVQDTPLDINNKSFLLLIKRHRESKYDPETSTLIINSQVINQQIQREEEKERKNNHFDYKELFTRRLSSAITNGIGTWAMDTAGKIDPVNSQNSWLDKLKRRRQVRKFINANKKNFVQIKK